MEVYAVLTFLLRWTAIWKLNSPSPCLQGEGVGGMEVYAVLTCLLRWTAIWKLNSPSPLLAGGRG